jgi:hypothetical protein
VLQACEHIVVLGLVLGPVLQACEHIVVLGLGMLPLRLLAVRQGLKSLSLYFYPEIVE